MIAKRAYGPKLSAMLMIWRAIKAAKPEFSMALLIANAQAIVIKISHEMYLVYFFGGKILVHAMMIVVMETKKNMSNRMLVIRSPTVAPTIMKISKLKANHLFFLEIGSSGSLPLANKRKTLDSPQVGMKESSAHNTKVSPS